MADLQFKNIAYGGIRNRGPQKSPKHADRPRTSEVRGPLSGAKSKMGPRPIAKSHRVTYHVPPRCVVGPWIS